MAFIDPHDPNALEEAAVRNELSRVFDVCQQCRKCTELCASFPLMFDLIDRYPDRDAGRLTPAEQDGIVDACHGCERCVSGCPYAPGVHEAAIDVPLAFRRADAMRTATHQLPIRRSIREGLVARTDVVGRLGTRWSPVVNALVGARPGGAVRRALQAATGVSSVSVIAPFARQRFSTWFRRRAPRAGDTARASVALYPVCLVEYQQPQIGEAAVQVFELNDVACTLAEGVGCCGAPWLHQGNLQRFTAVAAANVRALGRTVESGREIVIMQPTCAHVIRNDYVLHLATEEARTVAAHTHDASSFLLDLHRHGGGIDTDFVGEVPASIAHHEACHAVARGDVDASRELLELTGARVMTVSGCSGAGGTHALDPAHTRAATAMAVDLADRLGHCAAAVSTGTCASANAALQATAGVAPVHPLQVLALAYGCRPSG